MRRPRASCARPRPPGPAAAMVACLVAAASCRTVQRASARRRRRAPRSGRPSPAPPPGTPASPRRRPRGDPDRRARASRSARTRAWSSARRRAARSAIPLARATFVAASRQPPSPPALPGPGGEPRRRGGARGPSPTRVRGTTGHRSRASSRARERARTRCGWGTTRTRDEALRLANAWAGAGCPGRWVVEERRLPGARAGSACWRRATRWTRATIEPAAPDEDLLSADASPYRGLLEVRASDGGALTVINVAQHRGLPARRRAQRALARGLPAARGAQGAGGGRAQLRARTTRASSRAGATTSARPRPARSTRASRTEHRAHGPGGGGDAGRSSPPTAAGPINASTRPPAAGTPRTRENIFDGEPDSLPEGRGLRARDARPGARSAPGAPRARCREEARARPRRGPAPRAGRARAAHVLRAGARRDPHRRRDPGLASPARDGACTARAASARVPGALARRGHFVQYLVGSLCWEERAGGSSPPRTPTTC